MSLLSPSLEAFWAVVQKGTVLEAAKLVNLTQTGVTQRIRSLEKQLGVTLFTRSRTGMRLTGEGESLLRYVQAARDLEGETLYKLNGPSPRTFTEVCISGPADILRTRISGVSELIATRFPRTRLQIDFNSDGSVLEKLKAGSAHFALLAPSQAGSELQKISIPAQKYILVGSSAWKGRKISDILAKEVPIEGQFPGSAFLDFFKKYKLQNKISSNPHKTNSTEGLLAMAKTGLGYAVVCEKLAKPFLKEGSLINLSRELTLEAPICLAWYPRKEMPPYFKGIIDAFRNKA